METCTFRNIFKVIVNKINKDDFIDHLISLEVIDEPLYNKIINQDNEETQNDEILSRLSSSTVFMKKVLSYFEKLFENDNEKQKKCFFRLGFPTLPEKYIQRSEMKQIRDAIINLAEKPKLIVYGPLGYGKSCLLADALSDSLICNYFNYEIFWIDLSELENFNLPQIMWNLYRKVVAKIDKKHGYQSLIHCPDVNDLKYELNQAFDYLENPLLVLDNAKEQREDLIHHFYFNCKTVITTQYKNILGNEAAHIIEVNLGFSDQEFQQLFVDFYNRETQRLFEEIYQACKGHPMILALTLVYLNENKEEALNNKIILEELLDKFKQGEYNLNQYSYYKSIEAAIGMCVNNLPDNLRSYFHQLVVFREDVNIKPDVLQIFFNKSAMDVRNIMNEFANRSLIVRFYNESDTYIYGIHPIVVKYLRETCTDDEQIQFHQQLIHGYEIYTNNNLANLPNDNYILQFIAYHLCESGLYNKLKIYFDFTFLERKIKAAGPRDTLHDLKTYGHYIATNNNERKCIEELKKFIKKYGLDLYNSLYTDLMQCALQMPPDSFIYKTAEKAIDNSRVYFKISSTINNPTNNMQVLPLPETITVAVFADPNFIICGTKSGIILLYSREFEKVIDRYEGHDSPVIRLVVNKKHTHFLSVCVNGVAILWNIHKINSRRSLNMNRNNDESPRYKQHNWRDLYLPSGNRTYLKKFQLNNENNQNQDKIISAAFLSKFPDTDILFTGTEKGNVYVWSLGQDMEINQTGEHNGNAASDILVISNDDIDNICILQNTRIFIYAYKTETRSLFFKDALTSKEQHEILFVLDSSEKLLGVGERTLVVWDKSHYKFWESTHTISNNANERSLSAVLTTRHEYLFIGTNLNIVYRWDVIAGKAIEKFFITNISITYMDALSDNNYIHYIINGSDNRTIFNYRFHLNGKTQQFMNVLSSNWSKNRPITSVINSDNRIQIYQSCTLLCETNEIKENVTCMCFSLCTDYIVYGLDNGHVMKYNIKCKTDKILHKFKSSIKYLKYFDPENDNVRSMSSWGSFRSSNYEQKGILIIITEDNTLAAFDDSDCRIIQVTNTLHSPIIFNLMDYNFIIIDKHGELYNWQLNQHNDLESVLLPLYKFSGDTRKNHVNCAAVWENELLALCMTSMDSNKLDIFELHNRKVNFLQRLETNGTACSINFSADGKLLAIGMTSGQIEVRNIKLATKITLNLHQYSVNSLLFSPKMHFLVSVGDFFAMWNMEKFASVNDDCVSELNKEDHVLKVLAQKQSCENMPYLLSSIKLHPNAKLVLAASNFSSFLTVHENGNINTMEILHCDTNS